MSDEKSDAIDKADPHLVALATIESAKLFVDRAHPGPSREKALVHTKLDEAALWLGAMK